MDPVTYGALSKKMADPDKIAAAVDDWLDDHPEATTTVQDGSITKAKLDANLSGAIDDVSDLKSAINTMCVSRPIEENDDLALCDVAGNVIVSFENGNIKTKNFDSLKVSPNIITVRTDGTGDYTSLRDAVESITDADSMTNPYVIEIYEGTYNICSYYTQEEIESAGEEPYTDDSFVGLKLTDGISLRGIGCRDKVILYGYLDPETYTQANRNNIATLNTQGEMSLENLTVIGEKIRYAVHDDFHDSFRNTYKRNPKRVLKNCVFIGINTTGGSSYGAGSAGKRDFEITDCAFEKEGFGVHTGSGANTSMQIVMTNCSGVRCSFGDYSSANTDAVHTMILNDCNFRTFYIFKAQNGSYMGQHIKFFGTGGNDMIFNVPVGYVYQNGDVTKVKESLTLGKVVDADLDTATADNAYGVCIGTYDGLSYVQKSGYIKASLLGLTASEGDYIGISSGSVVVQNTQADSIGKVIEYGSNAYIKLTI